MLKLIIADDERVIRETISNLIDWKSLDAELIGLCSNGLEAYDMIIDESPDIVLTDIKMPGMSGLELIRKISETDLDTQFVILSGYGEFEYAKEAMKYGVKQYVLKPCSQSKIEEAIREVSKDCYARKQARNLENSQYLLTNNMQHNIMSSIIGESMGQDRRWEEILEEYEPYMDFHGTAYQLFYVYYLERESLEPFLAELRQYCLSYMPQVTLHGVYVNNTLLLFFKSFSEDYGEFTGYIRGLDFETQHVTLELAEEAYDSLQELLRVVLAKLTRYSNIYYINNFHSIYTCNYNYIIEETGRLYQQIRQGSAGDMDRMSEILSGIDDIDFLRQLSGSLMLKAALDDASLSTIRLTEWLAKANEETDIGRLKQMVISHLSEMLAEPRQESSYCAMTRQIFDYVENNLQNSNLTLNYIAEHCLYMNVDYVSKKFVKETGRKFSDYLTDVRIRKAKEYMMSGDKIQDIAEKVGCGKNPQYFSQLFKKRVGMTPTAYIAKYCGAGQAR